MTDQIHPAFHADLIVVFFNDYKDLRKVAERVGVLLSDASAEHIEAVWPAPGSVDTRLS
jgi:hypothetical protein